MTNNEECNIYATVVNVQKIKCELKGTVNMNIQGGEMAKLAEFLYVP